MRDVEARIQQAAQAFARAVMDELRNLSLSDLAALMRPGKRQNKPRQPRTPDPGVQTLTLSPKQVAARKVQGQYLGLMRHLDAKQRAKVKAIAKRDGVAAAVAHMRKG